MKIDRKEERKKIKREGNWTNRKGNSMYYTHTFALAVSN